LKKKRDPIDYLYWLAMALLVVWYAYSKGWIFANFQSIEAPEAIAMIERDNNISILDVRTIAEYKEGHLREATLIPLDHLNENLGMLKHDRDKQILVYCATGNRSISASRILESHGFTPINIKGGIFALANAKAEIIK
jgi:rhodanese-related sulfurtransferase